MADADITADRLRDVLHYDADTGAFTWRRAVGAARKGANAGMLERGYRRIKIDGRFYFAHRLAWLYMTNRWPADLIDHRNGDRSDNRWSNLRECSTAQNAQNTSTKTKARSGLKGVYWHSQRAKWQAQIEHVGKKMSLGLYSSKDDAHAAYLKAKARLHTFSPVLRDA
ncbi:MULTISPECIES: HNH endonuclease [unclassified Caballeronia]|uniref:HNH endonuclease n=1 Tax=unclassified Caballeronia TaxID=2646786 RepID=UPI002864E3E4|nr:MULTISPECIES: HNH endonuclease [unclassified Caballeronia]MDR5776274.1 HNH endonuclease [Caballeronia sp. LZ002]MDR5851715.1 HNH endonuclease [Caballeronia sp. LZ003]